MQNRFFYGELYKGCFCIFVVLIRFNNDRQNATAMLNMTISNFHFAFYLGKLHMRITADKNIIGTPKIRNDFQKLSNCEFFQYCNRNIRVLSFAPCKVKALNLLCFIFGIISLLHLFNVLSMYSYRSSNYCNNCCSSHF